MKPKTILLVEDNPTDAELIMIALKGEKLADEIEVVGDGVEALDYLRMQGQYKDRQPGNPAVIFLDLKLPRKDGIEVLIEIRNDESMKLIPIVMLTSSKEEQDMIRSYTFGVNAYVVKPVDFDQFILSIKQLGMFWVEINEIPESY